MITTYYVYFKDKQGSQWFEEIDFDHEPVGTELMDCVTDLYGTTWSHICKGPPGGTGGMAIILA